MTRNGEAAARGWNIALPVLGLALLLLLVLYRDTVLYLDALWSDWEEGSYSHGYLVLLISGYMIYSRRATLAGMAPCPVMPALLLVAVAALLWSVAAIVSVQSLQAVVLPLLVMSVTWTVLGTRVASRLLLPVLFIGLALPVWSPLLPYLRIITAESAFWLARVAGIPAFLQDFTIHLPSGRLSILDACSGLHYLLAGLTLGVFYAWLNYPRIWQRVLVVMTAAGAAILANILRVFIITRLAWTTEMQHPFVRDHLSLGWYLFGGLVLVLLVADLLFGRHPMQVRDGPVVPAGNGCRFRVVQWLGLFCVIAVLLAAGPLTVAWAAGQAGAAAVPVLHLPEGRRGWQGPVNETDSWQPQYRGAVTAKGVYRKDDAPVYLYVGYYPRQGQGAELVNELNRIANAGAWRVARSAVVTPGQGLARVIEAELVSPAGGKRLVWYRYRVAGRYTTSDYRAKFLQLAGLVSGETGAAVVAAAVDAGGDMHAARARLAAFMSAMDGSFALMIDE